MNNVIDAINYARCRSKRLFYRAIYPNKLYLGKHVTFKKDLTIYIAGGKRANVRIGDNTFFNNGCSINCIDSVSIGANCLFGENVKIYDHNHAFSNSAKLIKDQGLESAPIVIEDNCWIGSNAVILSGVHIHANTVVGAGAVVAKDVPSGVVLIAKHHNVHKAI